MGRYPSCGVGADVNGQLGNNVPADVLVPKAVDTSGVLAGKTVTAISAGLLHCLALRSKQDSRQLGIWHPRSIGKRRHFPEQHSSGGDHHLWNCIISEPIDRHCGRRMYSLALTSTGSVRLGETTPMASWATTAPLPALCQLLSRRSRKSMPSPRRPERPSPAVAPMAAFLPGARTATNWAIGRQHHHRADTLQ